MFTTTEAEGVALYAQAAAGPLASVPAEAWGPLAAIIAAVLALVGVLVGHVIGARGKARADAGQLALQLATTLDARVLVLERERNGYRNHAHVLHEWGGDVQTPENPRPAWPADLPR
ncbi:hypothetical protein MRBLMI12_000496 [Microbacterium sp. LMI12-1-1.1]|uniref:hypothetical protein n=1 Tax=Microbacterium sp. LMI12-1-1.1 TaxID=3135225 RepID=UPI00341E8C0C